jgi:predicted membrane protein
MRRDGDWILPRLFRIFAFWGNSEIDLTHALVGPGTSQIEIRCIMASVEIIVPPDLRVESEVDAVLGSAEVRREAASTTASDAPCVRITGSTFMGSIEIKVVDPNAPGLLEKIRRRIGRGG